ncbi:Methionine aminopeptidase [Mesoplasma florum W37]|uniref:Methionine aminopeptidase n=1 Tax=Mesoplasma florum TaxID=2151 RepID=A0AAD2PSL1_MESFO|nr:type I methionyl aminopeptidase [Mesoplasma florum]AGY41217.1 Methionine aminopeptidase [Mesoplasma florum W37]AVN59447.1 type I methionyl aminopeptidase [Mesoplasma florum]AVN65555.1 Methionine aminopeptidase [Mesoplasma florum]
MAVTIKSPQEIEKMRVAGQVLAQAIDMLKSMIKVGVNCLDLDKEFEKFITEKGCKSNFKNYHGYPKTICVSINEQLVHGIPQDRILEEGDIVSVDTGCVFEGYHADSAFSMIVGIAKDTKHDILLKVTEECLDLAIEALAPGVRIGTIGSIIQNHAESFGFGVPRDYTGHGIGTEMHEDPFIPNYGKKDTGMRLQAGMVICIEPMIQMGTFKTKLAADNWTVLSADKSMTAHFEHTILITDSGYEVLTKSKR